MLILYARKHAEFKLKSRIIPPTIFAGLGASMGWLVSSAMGTTVLGGLVGGLLAAGVYFAALWLWHRSYLFRQHSSIHARPPSSPETPRVNVGSQADFARTRWASQVASARS